MRALRDAALAYAQTHTQHIDAADRAWTLSAENLLHYLSVRSRDIRGLQDRLSHLGLSSLGRCEGHVLDNLESVLRMLGVDVPRSARRITIPKSHRLIDRHAADLLGAAPGTRDSGRGVRVLVTMPSEAADDPVLVRHLLESGMDCARINCAHDDPDVWERTIASIRRESKKLRRECRVLMDLAGPKVRVGPLAPGPRVLKVRPMRDELGRVTRPVVLRLEFRGGVRWANSAHAEPCDAVVPLDVGPKEFAVDPGAFIRFTDARGSRRRMLVRRASPGGIVAEIDRTAYILSGARLHATIAGRNAIARVGMLPERPGAVLLKPGDLLRMSDDPANPTGQIAATSVDAAEGLVASIVCLPQGVLGTVTTGQPVLFDDGKIEGIIRRVRRVRNATEATLAIVRARATGDRLREDKGVNLPESSLQVRSITDADVDTLQFVAEHADIVAQSFVRSADDLAELHTRLDDLGARSLGVVAKIETRQAFANLPAILFAGMRWPRFGVMIARGDLAVEVGYERLAEVQEEILWLCEAAHVPVIWATQVLEGLASSGRPSRAEITDAAMGSRAECVMLNKGPYITDAMKALDDILRRMHGHQHKKVARLRKLSIAKVLG